jgi:predicted O-methyltransferase YrrM
VIRYPQMDDLQFIGPPALDAIVRDSAWLGFTMASEPKTGALLRVLAAAKPGGRLLELGTGTGVGTAWLLAGMDASASLDSVENNPAVLDVARRHLGQDRRVRFHSVDAAEYLTRGTTETFDLVYADTWAGKFTHVDRALALVGPGGIYFIDDLLPQPNWPEGHAAMIPPLIAELERRSDFISTKLAWASGLMILARRHE